MELDLLVNVGLTAVGLVMLCYGGNWLVNGGVAIAKKLRISNIVIGMTVVAYGTSTPELAASIAATGNHSDIILGNIVGSNIANIGMVIGIAAIMVPLVVKKSTLKKDMPIMIGFSLLLIALSVDGNISQYDGVILIGLLIAFTIYTYRDAHSQRGEDNGDFPSEKGNVYLRAFGLIGIGVVLLYFGAEFTINNAEIIAQQFGISERIIGLTVIAIGTSLPELITSIIAIRKGHTDIGVGNIIGSNIYNILMIMGVASALYGVTVSGEVFVDYAIMIAFSSALLFVMFKGIITRNVGIALVMGYMIYLISEFMLD